MNRFAAIDYRGVSSRTRSHNRDSPIPSRGFSADKIYLARLLPGYEKMRYGKTGRLIRLSGTYERRDGK